MFLLTSLARSLAVPLLALLCALIPQVTDATTPIPISLFTDERCHDASLINAKVSIPLGVCAVTPGLVSFDLEAISCSTNNVQAYAYSDQVCGTIDYNVGPFETCFESDEGPIGSILLSCEEDDVPAPTATTTITVGTVASQDAASSTPSTPSAASSTVTAESETTSSANSRPSESTTLSTSSKGGASTSATSTSSASSSTNTGSSGGGSSIGSVSPNTCSGWSCLTTGERVGIIVALVVGIPPILIALYMLYLKKKKDAKKRQQERYPELQQPWGQGHGSYQQPTYA